MSNKLTRSGAVFYKPATPYTPAKPSYTWIETVTTQVISFARTGWVYASSKLNASANLSNFGQLIYTGEGSGSYITTKTTTVAHVVPATAAVPASPSVRTEVPPAGWNAYAHSNKALFAVGLAKWKIGLGIQGVAIGLSANTAAPTSGYGHITHGLLFTGGRVYNLRSGALYGTYLSEEFSVRVQGGLVTYYKAGASIGSEASTFGPSTLVLAAALYGNGDNAYDPSLSPVVQGGSGVTVLGKLRAVASSRPLAQSAGVLPRLATATYPGQLSLDPDNPGPGYYQQATAHATLGALLAYATDHNGAGQALNTLEVLLGSAYGGTLLVAPRNSSDTALPELAGIGIMFTGGGGGSGTADGPGESGNGGGSSNARGPGLLPALTTISSSRIYGVARATLPAMRSLSYTQPRDEAYMLETTSTELSANGSAVVVAIMQSGIQVAATHIPASLLLAVMQEAVAGATGFATSQLMQAVLVAFLSSGDQTQGPVGTAAQAAAEAAEVAYEASLEVRDAVLAAIGAAAGAGDAATSAAVLAAAAAADQAATAGAAAAAAAGDPIAAGQAAAVASTAAAQATAAAVAAQVAAVAAGTSAAAEAAAAAQAAAAAAQAVASAAAAVAAAAQAAASAFNPGGAADTWVFNVDAKGSTAYTGFDFNSYAQIGTRFFGANANGIFELDGDTDAGAPIRASVGLGTRDFGTSKKKVISEAFVGMAGDGNLMLKVIAEGEAYVYTTRNFSEELQQQRLKMGRGLKANYLTIELYNEDGADFELDTIEFMVADLSRKD